MEFTFKTLNEVGVIDQQLITSYNRLISQLRNEETSVTKEELEEVLRREGSELLVCALSSENTLVAIAQGTYICTPPSYLLYINTVVVDENARGGGLGTKIMEHIEREAIMRWPNIVKISLTSRPNRGTRPFYERLGYIARVPENNNETTVFLKIVKKES